MLVRGKLLVGALSATLVLTGCKTALESVGIVEKEDTTVCAPQRDAFSDAVDLAQFTQEGSVIGGDILRSISEYYIGPVFTSALESNFSEALTDLNQSIEEDTANMTDAAVKLEVLHACRVQLAAEINSDLRAGRITRTQAEADMTTLRELTEADVARAQEMLDDVQARTGDFRVASLEAKTKARGASQTRSVAQVEDALVTNQAVYEDTQEEVQVVRAAAPSTFSLDARLWWQHPLGLPV